jgi:hypothetical protein
MNCTDLEILLCDYVDGTLGREDRAAIERHLAECPVCTELARDAAGAVAFIGRAAEIEPPPDLLTRILFEVRGEKPDVSRSAGWRKILSQWLHPILQPRFAMGMAMTILSFSMLGRFAGIQVRQLRLDDLDPVRIVSVLDDRVHRSWEAVVKYYDSLRLVYDIQTRIREFTDPEEGDDHTPAATSQDRTEGGSGASGKSDKTGKTDQKKKELRGVR